MYEIRELLRSKRDTYPEWEVRRDGVVIGWIRAHRIRTSSTLFYRATGICPTTGRPVNLENSPDFDERVAVVRAFHTNPEPWRGLHWHPPTPA